MPLAVTLRAGLPALLALAACQAQPAAPPAAAPTPPRWATLAGHEGMGAHLFQADGAVVASLECLRDTGEVRVRVPGFKPIPSEDRLSLGLGAPGDPVALAADLTDPAPGVTALGPIADMPDRLLQARELGLTYGAQTLGPLPPPAADQLKTLAEACRAATARP